MWAHHDMRAGRVSGRRRRQFKSICGVLGIIAVGVVMGEVAWTQPLQDGRELGASPTFSELVSLVARHGWTVDLGRMCKTMALDPTEKKCRFLQIAFNSSGDAFDRHGFNLPVDTDNRSYILMFHLRPLIGEFFVVSTGGRLIKTFFRARGIDYGPVPDESGSAAFEKELAYWRANFAQIERDLSKRSR